MTDYARPNRVSRTFLNTFKKRWVSHNLCRGWDLRTLTQISRDRCFVVSVCRATERPCMMVACKTRESFLPVGRLECQDLRTSASRSQKCHNQKRARCWYARFTSPLIHTCAVA